MYFSSVALSNLPDGGIAVKPGIKGSDASAMVAYSSTNAAIWVLRAAVVEFCIVRMGHQIKVLASSQRLIIFDLLKRDLAAVGTICYFLRPANDQSKSGI